MLETIKRNWLAVILALGIVCLAFVAQAVQAKQDEEKKVTICHATSSEENPWVRIVVSENAIGGHFDNPGTPKAGHEDDVLLEGEQDCPPPEEEPDDEDTPEEPNDGGTGGGNAEDETKVEDVTNHPTSLPAVGSDGK